MKNIQLIASNGTCCKIMSEKCSVTRGEVFQDFNLGSGRPFQFAISAKTLVMHKIMGISGENILPTNTLCKCGILKDVKFCSKMLYASAFLWAQLLRNAIIHQQP